MVKVIVAGSRGFHNYKDMALKLIEYFQSKGLSPKDVEIISGTANGADKLGELFARKAKCKLTRMPAKWDVHGRSAGYIRNCDMAEYAGSDGVCFVFWDGISKGSMHMANIAKRKGLETYIIKN